MWVETTATWPITFLGITVLPSSNYVVESDTWNGAAGASTWCNGAMMTAGPVSSSNSLVGATEGGWVDCLGWQGQLTSGGGTIVLANGNYVVCSPDWNDIDDSEHDNGAITWVDGLTGTTGTVSSDNSLIGGLNENVGFGGVTALKNGNYVVDTKYWNNPQYESGYSVGAVTWCNGQTGTDGVVSVANSLIGVLGSTLANDGLLTGDNIGSGGVTALANGGYVVSSPNWNGDAGAVTWCDGTKPTSATVTADNSLVGSSAGDHVGSLSVTALTNGNYVVASPDWDNTAGAVTWGNGANGTTVGPVTNENSLVGTYAGDQVGGVFMAVPVLSVLPMSLQAESPLSRTETMSWPARPGTIRWAPRPGKRQRWDRRSSIGR